MHETKRGNELRSSGNKGGMKKDVKKQKITKSENIKLREECFVTNRCLPIKVQMHLLATNAHLPLYFISSACSPIKRPEYLSLYSDLATNSKSPRNPNSIIDTGHRFSSSSPKRADRLRGLPSLLTDTWALHVGQSDRGVTLTTHLHAVSRLR